MDNQKLLSNLLSQLDECRFTELITSLLNDNSPFNEAFPLISQNVEDSNLWYKLAGKIGSYTSWAASWFFQVVHVPPLFIANKINFHDFLINQIQTCFKGMVKNPSICEILNSKVVPYKRYSPSVFIPFDNSCGPPHYYIAANIADELLFSDELINKVENIANQIFGHRINQLPIFGSTTPAFILKQEDKIKNKVFSYLSEILNAPSDYYIIAREGEISVTPASSHGLYFSSYISSSNIKNVPIGSTISITRPVKLTKPNLQLGFTELNKLLNSKNLKEADIQDLFESNPELLFSLDSRYCEIRPHVCLSDIKDNKLIPDFMARIEDKNIWDIIELKLPKYKIYSNRDKGINPAKQAAEGIAQLLKYKTFFSYSYNRRKMIDRYGFTAFNPNLILVIGRGLGTSIYEWNSIKKTFPNVQVVTYDYLIDKMKQCLSSISYVNTINNYYSDN